MCAEHLRKLDPLSPSLSQKGCIANAKTMQYFTYLHKLYWLQWKILHFNTEMLPLKLTVSWVTQCKNHDSNFGLSLHQFSLPCSEFRWILCCMNEFVHAYEWILRKRNNETQDWIKGAGFGNKISGALCKLNILIIKFKGWRDKKPTHHVPILTLRRQK